MLAKVGRIINNPVARNTFFLGIMQIVNYLFPLITLPYLIKTLGAGPYGVIALSQIALGYLTIISDYGFNLTATKEIAINRENRQRLNRIFSETLATKGVIALVASLLILPLLWLVPSARQYPLLYLLMLLSVAGNVLLPTWFFQGMEKMGLVVIFTSIFKLILTLLIFVFVKGVGDIWLVGLFTLIGSVVSGLAALWYAVKKYSVRFVAVGRDAVIQNLKDGFDVFLPTIFASVLSSGGVFVLGLSYPPAYVGYYSAIDRLTKAGIALLSSVTQSLFPNIARKFQVSKREAINSITRVGGLVIGLLVIALLIVILWGGDVLALIYTPDYHKFNYILIWQMVWTILAFLNNFIGIQFLLGAGYNSFYRKAFIYSAVATVLCFPFISFTGINGVLLSIMVGEFVLTFFNAYFIFKHKLYEEDTGSLRHPA